MHTEIERKFLVKDMSWRHEAKGIAYCQGYIHSTPNYFVRIRTEGEKACITIKGPKKGIGRKEFEYSIPLEDAQNILETMAFKPLIYKYRYKIPLENHIWEIDVFQAENTGLIVAEVELRHENETFIRPFWLGEEVTYDARYRNAALAKHPYSLWSEEEKNSHMVF